jgi:hypothetical protein
MRKRIALGAISMGLLVACGPVAVDLGGGVAGRAGSGGTEHGATGGVGGAYANGGARGEDFICGDGIVQYPERCDDAQRGVECPLDCGIEEYGGTGGTGYAGAPGQVCGDGVIQYPEECDDARGLDPACGPDCRIRYEGGGGTGGSSGQACGDGVIQYPEECDDPRGLDPACGPDCRIRYEGGGGTGGSSGQVCGDGVIQYPEECDDPRGLDPLCMPDCRIRVTGSGGTGGTFGGAGGGYATGGTGGDPRAGAGGTSGDVTCVAEVVGATGECADNDVLLGQAYERCMQLGRSLASVRFDAPCDDYASRSIAIECCALVDGGTAGSPG